MDHAFKGSKEQTNNMAGQEREKAEGQAAGKNTTTPIKM
jgi:hypothetical protein